MRILQVIAAKGYGGAEKHLLILSQGLLAAGHEVICVVPKRSWIAEECQRLGLPHRTMTFRGAYDFLAIGLLRHFIKKWQAEIVHGHLTRASRYVNLATRKTKGLPVNTCHATSSHSHMRTSKKVIAVSQAVKENLLRHGYPDEQIEVIYNGVPPAAIGQRAEIRRELQIPAEVFAMVCVGRMVRDKGQQNLIEIISELPERIHLYLIGDTDTPYGKQLLELSNNHPRIHFMGFRADVLRVLSAFDLCVAPSRREALSIALIEASQAGLPIVANRVGGIPEVVAEHRSGILVTPQDNRQLAEQLIALAANPSLLAEFGNHARQIYATKFTAEQMTAATLGVYRKVLTE